MSIALSSEALEYLSSARRFGMKLGLDSMRTLVDALGNPQNHLRFIHIAGTNGKGSTAAFCASILEQQGYRTGLYTSPHLIDLSERFQINRRSIELGLLSDLILRVRDAANRMSLQPSFFEILTAVALLYFKSAAVDWVVWETGLGGRLDATSVVTPDVCIITQIGMDHEAYLGSTVGAIAAEKAGILKSGVPAITSATGEALEVIEKRAAEIGAPLTIASTGKEGSLGELRMGRWIACIDGKEWELGLCGEHQSMNAVCVLEAMKALKKKGVAIEMSALQSGFAKTTWPGRFQRLSENPPLVVDGAHNASGAEALLKTWRGCYGDAKYHLVFGCLSDKSFQEVARILRDGADSVSVVMPRSERALSGSEGVALFAGIQVSDEGTLQVFWPKLIRMNETSPVLMAGSLFLAGEAIALFENRNFIASLEMNERLSSHGGRF